MIEDKAEYLAKWQILYDRQNEALEDLASVSEIREKFGDVNLGELVDRLQEKADEATEEFHEYTKEEDELREKVFREYSSAQIESWIAMGYSTLDIIYEYLQGNIDDYKIKHNFFTEAKMALGVYGSTDTMSDAIRREVMRETKERAKKYVDEETGANPDPDVHYKVTWGHENNENIDGVWDDAVLLEDELTGLYFKNLADGERCDEFEYIKEIRRLPKPADGTESK